MRTSDSMVSISQPALSRQNFWRSYNWVMARLARMSAVRRLLLSIIPCGVLSAGIALGAAQQQQQPPPPQPFPRPGAPQPARPAPEQPPSTTPARPGVAPPQPDKPPTEEFLGVPIYPGAQFIASNDAGRGQRYYIFGTAGSFVELVAYYRTVLKQRGELVYEIPATHSFDVGRYREETMAFPPGVTIKDYESDVSKGYPNPQPGGQPARFPTLIQIVPVTEK